MIGKEEFALKTSRKGREEKCGKKDEAVEPFSGLWAFTRFYQWWSHPIGDGARS